MAGYMTVAEFRSRTIMPGEDVDSLEIVKPGFLQVTLDDWSDEINARLRKRYAVPFAAPTPPIILRWLNKLATREAYHARGYNPSSKEDQVAIEDAANRIEVELKEAADSKDGLFELPLRADNASSGVAVGGPLSYSETSPYKWTDVQRSAAELEDTSR